MDRYIIHWAVTVQDKKQTPKTQKQTKQTKTQQANNPNQNKNQHGRWSADQFIGNWKTQEEMITLYHLRDWYGNVKQKRNNKPQSAIQQSVSQEATDAQCGNQGSPQPGASRSQSASRTGNILTDSWTRSKSQQDAGLSHLVSRRWKVKRGMKAELRWNDKETNGAQGPLRVLSGVLCLSSALSGF